MIFFISDTHFSHANIIRYTRRPFANVQEMNATMIANWNSVVKDGDNVFHLGDVGFGKESEVSAIVAQLLGHKHLILGNHDRLRGCAYKRMGFESVTDWNTIRIGHKRVWMAHRPENLTSNDGLVSGYTHYLHGHVHGSFLRPEPNTFDVSVEVIGYRPVTLDELVRLGTLHRLQLTSGQNSLERHPETRSGALLMYSGRDLGTSQDPVQY